MTAKNPLFPELTPAYLQHLMRYSVARKYPKNTVMINEGDRDESLYIILKGKVKVYLNDNKGKEAILRIEGPGAYFGELALIDAAPRSASVMTLLPTELAVVSKNDFKRCLAESPKIALDLLQSLSSRVRALTESVRNLALMDVYGRVARTLVNLTSEEAGHRVIEQRLTHQEIANMVGASREMVSRIMKDLSTGGYIQLKDKKITIPGKLPAAW